MLDQSNSAAAQLLKWNDLGPVGTFVARLKEKSVRLWQVAAVLAILAALLTTAGIGLISNPDNAPIDLTRSRDYLQVPHDLGANVNVTLGHDDWSHGDFGTVEIPRERWRPLVIAVSLAFPIFIGFWQWRKFTGSMRQKVIKAIILFNLPFLAVFFLLSDAMERHTSNFVMNRSPDFAIFSNYMEDSRHPSEDIVDESSVAEHYRKNESVETVWCDRPAKGALVGTGITVRAREAHKCIVTVDLQNLAPPIADQARYVFAQIAYMHKKDVLALRYLSEMTGAWRISDDVAAIRLRIMITNLQFRHPNVSLPIVHDMLRQRNGNRIATLWGFACLASSVLLLFIAFLLGWTGTRRFRNSRLFSDILHQIEERHQKSTMSLKR